MIKKTLHFANPAYLSLANNQLCIEIKQDSTTTKRQIPIEDIGIIILANPQITLTHALMAALVSNNAAIVTSASNFMPNGLLLPIEANTIQSERYKQQIAATLPLKKYLWQQTVQAKILNQAAVLTQNQVNITNMLRWARAVKSGDTDNYEARAAVFYWKNMFPNSPNFTRDKAGLPPNNLLNYGYAILRAMVARALVASGLLPTLGIHHKNKYNAYCLADDIMEPYRPYVDLLVLNIVNTNELAQINELNNTIKQQLLTIPVIDVHFQNRKSPLMVAIQHSTASLAKCFSGSARKINYPLIKEHQYRGLKPLFFNNQLTDAESDDENDLPF